MRIKVSSFFIFYCVLMTGCSVQTEHPDLHKFMSEARNQKGSRIPALPIAKPYVTFTYNALAMRSPFEAPILFVSEMDTAKKSSVKPDENRPKELLESFNFAALTMVGGLRKDGTTWSLIDDGEKRIHRVRIGNYVGKNHGRVVDIGSTKLELIEIVPDGKGGWLERPRTLALREKE